MQDSEVKQDFEKLSSFNGIDVFMIGTDKFKTNTINFLTLASKSYDIF